MKPEGAFYAFINVQQTGLTSQEFAHGLLETEQVCVVPGDAFGAEGEGFVRLSYAAKDELLVAGMRRMERFVARQLADRA